MNTPHFRLELTTTDNDSRPIYVAGNFNSWALEDQQFRLRKVDNGKFAIDFPPFIKLPTPFEYKYTRGDWRHVELGEFGQRVPNRKIETPKGLIQDKVPRWTSNGNYFKKEYLPEKILVADNFEIPQLNRKRRVQALLPHDYHTSGKHYPVLYMHDAQNLFDKNSPYGNWAIDERLAVMAEDNMSDVIIVAIDHASENRLKEYTPTNGSTIGMGQGKPYLNFITKTLKPHIDKKFRTKAQREFTGIGGSSMGGLISIYAGFAHPKTFGRLLIFSPSLWVTPKIHFKLIRMLSPDEMKIYVYAGGDEGANMIPNVLRFKNVIETQGVHSKIDFELSIDQHGRHNEDRWGLEFPSAVKYLFF